MKEEVLNINMSVLKALEEKYLNFKLGEEQVNVLLSIFNFITSDKKHCVLEGNGGSGKTTITKIIIKFLELNSISYALATPTHKSKKILSNSTGREVETLHKILTLRPNIDIMELDFKDLKWQSNTMDNGVPYNGILIIDECSMVNTALFEHIMKICEDKGTKIIMQGDSKQLIPVKEKTLSKSFKGDLILALTKVYRQLEDNPILDVLSTLREKPLYRFNQIHNKNGDLLTYSSWKNLLKDNICHFKKAIKTNNPDEIKLIAYTNKRIESFNTVIRKLLFNNDEEYNIGDLLVGYDSCEFKVANQLSHNIGNSLEYQIVNIEAKEKVIGFTRYKGYNLTIYSFDEEYEFTVFILSRDNSVDDFNILAAYIETMRMDAVRCKNSRLKNQKWVEYFNLNGSFLTPVDLHYNNRLVRRKSLDYGYCITVHKSQSSSYNNVIVDMDNIFICKNEMELRQLQYVALSRTRKDIKMLIKQYD